MKNDYKGIILNLRVQCWVRYIEMPQSHTYYTHRSERNLDSSILDTEKLVISYTVIIE